MTRPLLFQRFPALAEGIPWIGLGDLPTPVEAVPGLGGGRLWVKRDDLSSRRYGGNKVRKLEFALADARRLGKQTIVTLGGTGTHHGLATTIFAGTLGMQCRILTFRQPLTVQVRDNLRLLAHHGAELSDCRTMGRALLHYYLVERLRRPGAYFYFAGGSSPLGTLGFVDAAFELKAQIEAGQAPAPAVVFLAAGSNGTLAGLTLGLRLAGIQARVLGVRVTPARCGPFPACTPGEARRLMIAAWRLLKRHCPDLSQMDVTAPEMTGAYFGGGYGTPTAAGTRAAQAALETVGIDLEPTYTAKAFAAVLDYLENSRPGPVLYWHTYNGVDLGTEAAQADISRLPAALRRMAA
ncbi:MAG: pyridoxal-phosphate dependent enzyme [Desulfobacteraceae bacterium]|jgi:D-cysteine desulfhydrase|nr:pyridoxal-phosphate dependent enzyme [Desulfobacteraceae bacterium]